MVSPAVASIGPPFPAFVENKRMTMPVVSSLQVHAGIFQLQRPLYKKSKARLYFRILLLSTAAEMDQFGDQKKSSPWIVLLHVERRKILHLVVVVATASFWSIRGKEAILSVWWKTQRSISPLLPLCSLSHVFEAISRINGSIDTENCANSRRTRAIAMYPTTTPRIVRLRDGSNGKGTNTDSWNLISRQPWQSKESNCWRILDLCSMVLAVFGSKRSPSWRNFAQDLAIAMFLGKCDRSVRALSPTCSRRSRLTYLCNSLLHGNDQSSYHPSSSNYRENPQLAIWVKCQRRQYRLLQDCQRSSMNQSRIRELEQLGFRWVIRNQLRGSPWAREVLLKLG